VDCNLTYKATINVDCYFFVGFGVDFVGFVDFISDAAAAAQRLPDSV
jgi:hypothetical protein|tara:strand:- start:614 stop:754 length:141 start_codon:yes stop_codon:yes gene_type:complete